MQNILTVEGLTFGYGEACILRQTGLCVQKGDFAGIIGSNGAGKSTLLKLMLGELTPQGGRIVLFGQAAQDFREWPRIGYVPQNSTVSAAGFPANAAEVVEANLYQGPLRFSRKGRRERAKQALSVVEMADFAGHLIGELSGGQLQRVMLARALVAQPELLLLDEPTAGVDAQSVELIYRLLEKLNRQGITIVMVTHDMHRAAQSMRRVFCLEHGTVVELDKAQIALELEHRHRHP